MSKQYTNNMLKREKPVIEVGLPLKETSAYFEQQKETRHKRKGGKKTCQLEHESDVHDLVMIIRMAKIFQGLPPGWEAEGGFQAM